MTMVKEENPIPIIKESNLFKKINYLEKNLLVKHLKIIHRCLEVSWNTSKTS